MATSNDDYLDASLRHQIGLRRYSAGIAQRVADLLARADVDLTEKLKVRLARFEGKAVDFTSERWQLLLADIREARLTALGQVKALAREELGKLPGIEAAKEQALLSASIPIEINFATVAADQLRAISTSRPFHGKLLKEWFKELEQRDGQRLIQALQIGMTNGEPTPDIVRRVVGTKANKYTDGILSITRRDATTIIRTAVNHVSNTARGYVWEENSDIIRAKVWHSTLDGRTSTVCRARDGLAAPVGDAELPPGLLPLKPPSLRPPAHMGCRSTMVALIDGDALLGDRPYVVDTRTPDKRRTDFKAQAAESGEDVKKIRKEWVSTHIGRTPASTTYGEFLARQSPGFQDSVLGKTKGKLFRTGKLPLQEYVDRRGTELSLKQLAKSRPEAFRAADLDPESFAD